MKGKLTKSGFAAALMCGLMFMSGCASWVNHNTANIAQHQTQVVLSRNNYKIIRTVSGESSQTYVFGFGGCSKESLQSDALRDMYAAANLTGSQALINVSVTYSRLDSLFVMTLGCVATGTVIEFTE